MDNVTLPSGLFLLEFGSMFNQPIDNVALPARLRNLHFGESFNQSLEKVALPSDLMNLSFGFEFNQPMDKVALPNSLLWLFLEQTYDHLGSIPEIPHLQIRWGEEVLSLQLDLESDLDD